MLDFTSALYLGMLHRKDALAAWEQLTMGRPAALGAQPGEAPLAGRLAQLAGCPAGALGTSTLHLFWDLFGVLASRPIHVLQDAGAYPVARWGAERAAGRGAPVGSFAHHDPDALEAALRRRPRGLRPVVVTDGLCPVCGQPAPLAAYLEITRRRAGLLVIDDTQALGILGSGPDTANPYGVGGGGSLRYHGLSGPDVLLISSLAKAFGAPIAALLGGPGVVRAFTEASETRVHCSPPSAAAVLAAERALVVNALRGERLRQRLLSRVGLLRGLLAGAPVEISGGPFPVQQLRLIEPIDPLVVQRRLLLRGVRALLLRSHRSSDARIGLMLTVQHSDAALAYTARSVLCAVGRGSGPLTPPAPCGLPGASARPGR